MCRSPTDSAPIRPLHSSAFNHAPPQRRSCILHPECPFHLTLPPCPWHRVPPFHRPLTTHSTQAPLQFLPRWRGRTRLSAVCKLERAHCANIIYTQWDRALAKPLGLDPLAHSFAWRFTILHVLFVSRVVGVDAQVILSPRICAWVPQPIRFEALIDSVDLISWWGDFYS